MTMLDDLRERHPEYKDVPDAQLADGLYRKFYADKLSREDFNARVGLRAAPSWLQRFAGAVDEPIQPAVGLDKNALVDLSTPEGRQAAADFLAQGAGTAAGIAAGAPGGPPGMMIGGGAGNLAGKILSRKLMGGEEPSLGEGAVDAAIGAAGPVMAGPMRSLEKAAGRIFAGGSTENVKRVADTAGRARGAKEMHRAAEGEAAAAAQEQRLKGRMLEVAPSAQTDEAARLASVTALTASRAEFDAALAAAELKGKAEKEYARALRSAVNNLQPATKTNIGLATTGALVLSDPVTAVLTFAGGHAVRGVHKWAADKLLRSERFLEWALTKPANTPRNAINNSLAALLASKTLDSGEQSAVTELRNALDGDTPQRESSRPAPKGDRRSDAPRDSRGRFAKPRLVLGENYSFADLARARREGGP
jgi:hypothetical protein